jgi:GTP-binding protein
MEVRNIAIIAHVDHGKTTLTDALMKQTGMCAEGQSMDSDKLEQERGITIYSKNTSIVYNDTKINIVDTPGHADFGSEVERVLRSIDSVLLVVDAQEGPMPQTRFVLKKSLELGLKPIVVINKIDKPAAQIPEVEEMVYELFLDLEANDEQLSFPVIYANAKQGLATKDMAVEGKNLIPIIDTIIEYVAPASSSEKEAQPLRLQPFNLAYDNFLGRLAVGRVYEGKVSQAQTVKIIDNDGKIRTGKITKLFTFNGIERKEVKEAVAGDIVMVAGLPDIFIGETICVDDGQEPLPHIKIDEPTISLNFFVNDSPCAGQEGKHVTNSKLKERLQKELEVNVGLKIDFSETTHYKVLGRGELHIAILLENMRREGFELQVSQPTVIIKEVDGEKQEPYEEVTVDVPDEMSGAIIEKMAKRKGSLLEMVSKNGHTRLNFEIPVRGLLGYRTEFVVDTRGEGVLYSRMIGFKKYAGEIAKAETGSMISMATGKALGFSLFNLQNRGSLFIGANVNVYEGMVVGNVTKGHDMEVNPIKGKQLSNMRSSGADEAINLTPPIEITIEKGFGFMKDDEYLEVTPLNIRLRKKYLTKNDRNKHGIK